MGVYLFFFDLRVSCTLFLDRYFIGAIFYFYLQVRCTFFYHCAYQLRAQIQLLGGFKKSGAPSYVLVACGGHVIPVKFGERLSYFIHRFVISSLPCRST